MYTSIPRVRTLTGFTDTADYPDALITSKIKIASGMVDSAVGYNYALPLPYHFSNTLAFKGRATGSDSLVVVINSVNYTISLVADDNNASVADKFRIAAKDSVDFITDDLGSGPIVTILSRTDSASATTAYAEVDVTDPADVVAVGIDVGVRVKQYPTVLEQITAEIAAALFFIDQYGIESQNSGKDGMTRMDSVNATLQKLQGVHSSNQRIIIFDDVTKTEIPSSTSAAVTSYPNEVSNVSTTDSTAPFITMNSVF